MRTILMAATWAALITGCSSRNSIEPDDQAGAAAIGSHTLTIVDSIEPIRSAFNAHADKPRVVLLVSPVCSECVFGARAVRTSIMDRFEVSGVRAIVVWEPMLAPDNEAAARESATIFAGTSAVQFYDPQRTAGWQYQREHFSRAWEEASEALPADHWLREVVDEKPAPGPEWDVYVLYRPGARWEDQPPRPDAFIRHIGRDEHGRSRYFRDRFDTPPLSGDLFEAMEAMGRDVLGSR